MLLGLSQSVYNHADKYFHVSVIINGSYFLLINSITTQHASEQKVIAFVKLITLNIVTVADRCLNMKQTVELCYMREITKINWNAAVSKCAVINSNNCCDEVSRPLEHFDTILYFQSNINKIFDENCIPGTI